MLSFLSVAATGISVLLASAPALEDAPPRVRGTLTAVGDGSITVKERDGRLISLQTDANTTYAYVVPAKLDDIKVDDFIGTASKGAPEDWIAVEIVIIPEGLRAGRSGLAGWDPLPDTSGVDTSGTTATTMTNGSVSDVSPATQHLTETSMTNGTVVASGDGAAGRVLTLTLVGGKAARIRVSPTAPITRFVEADRSALSVRSAVFVKTDPGNRAALVAAGKGVSPPM